MTDAVGTIKHDATIGVGAHILVSGSIAYDRIMVFPGLFKDHFLQDKLHNINVSFSVDKFTENFGGTAGNIAYNLTLLGLQPKIISTAGSDFGRYREYLKSLGIDPDSIRIDSEQLTSTAFIVTDKADNQITAFSLASGGKSYTPLPNTKNASCAIIGAGSPSDTRRLPAHYRAAKLPYFYDPAQSIPVLTPDDLRDGVLGSAGLFGNDYELGLIMKKTGWDEATLVEKTSMVVTTYGEGGTRIASKEGEWKVEAVPVGEVVDPTGAGDAYRAGFIAGFLQGLTPDKMARLGSAIAVYAVENYGTQNHHFTREEFAERYKTAYGEQLPM